VKNSSKRIDQWCSKST